MPEKVKLRNGVITQEFDTETAKYLVSRGWGVVKDAPEKETPSKKDSKDGWK